jgi:hypothetical protein
LVRDALDEHRGGADPEAAFAIEGLVNDERLKRFGMAREADDTVVVALVMAVETGAGLGGEGRGGGRHGAGGGRRADVGDFQRGKIVSAEAAVTRDALVGVMSGVGGDEKTGDDALARARGDWACA